MSKPPRRINDVALVFRPGELPLAVQGEEALRTALRDLQARLYDVEVPREDDAGPYVDEFDAYAEHEPTGVEITYALALVYGIFGASEPASIRARPQRGEMARVAGPNRRTTPFDIVIDAVLGLHESSERDFVVRDSSGAHWVVRPRQSGLGSAAPRWYASAVAAIDVDGTSGEDSLAAAS